MVPGPKESAERALVKQDKSEKDTRLEEVLAAISEHENDIYAGLLADKLKEGEYPPAGRDYAEVPGDKTPEKESKLAQELRLKQHGR